jgi:hypothetical protein
MESSSVGWIPYPLPEGIGMMSVCFHTFAVYRLPNTKKKEKGDNSVFRQVADTLLPERLPPSGGIGICSAGFHAFAVCCLPKNYWKEKMAIPCSGK